MNDTALAVFIVIYLLGVAVTALDLSYKGWRNHWEGGRLQYTRVSDHLLNAIIAALWPLAALVIAAVAIAVLMDQRR